MKIRIVFNSTTRLADSSIKYERYLDGFRDLGHSAELITTEASARGVSWATTVPDAAELRAPALWEAEKPDLVLLPTWLGATELLSAIRPYTRYLVSLTDSDGYLGARVHPSQVLRRLCALQPSVSGKMRAAGWWLRQYLGAYRRPDASVLESCRLCDRVVVCSPGARANLLAFFRFHRAEELARRLTVAPYPVEPDFETAPISSERADQILAIGRWADPQKAGGVLAAAIGAFIRGGGRARVLLVGSGGETMFAPLTIRFPGQVEYLGVALPDRVRELLDQSRVLICTSWWESGPIVATEALLRGCSLVGPASIPTFRQYCSEGGCGTVYHRASPRFIAAALQDELRAWETGNRDPHDIAASWRDYFTPQAVCRQLLDSLPAEAPQRLVRPAGSVLP
jgi:hypothetical protein